tara:strand:- start:80 stop:337 length:258 start_codon:yes stop_codon:yes gene_type:complete
MLRVRSQSGKTIVVEEPLHYVEILDGNGDVSMVFYRDDMEDTKAVAIITPDFEEECESYSKLYKVKWSSELRGRWRKSQKMTVNK